MKPALVLCLLMGSVPAGSTPLPDGVREVSFEKDVLPILKQRCVSCHKPDKKKGKLDLSTYADLMKGGKQGPPIQPGQPDKSILVESISGPEPEMPEKGDKLTSAEVDLIRRWVAEGARRN